MSKKGATQSGGTAGRKRAKDSAMAAHLPPAPASWNHHPTAFPYHMNKGAKRRRPEGGEPPAKRSSFT